MRCFCTLLSSAILATQFAANLTCAHVLRNQLVLNVLHKIMLSEKHAGAWFGCAVMPQRQ